MDAKLTLSIRPDVIARAKEWARKEGKSLSAAVEELLDKAIRQDAREKSSLDIIKELGAERKSDRHLTDEEYEQRKRDHLMMKYGGK
jgi:hypothetical protein